jgi:hypothetical protein
MRLSNGPMAEDSMAIVGPNPDPWNLRFRIRRTIRQLSGASAEELSSLVWDRLRRVPQPNLPPVEREEYPADLFIDLVRAVKDTDDAFLSRRVADACAGLIERELASEHFKDVAALGELIYLAGRIEAHTALEPLAQLASHKDAGTYLPNRETIRLRSLRSLVGLLAAHPEKARDSHRQILERYLMEPSCTYTAMTALIGLFGVSRSSLIERLRNSTISINEDVLDLNLRVAGFQSTV